MTHQAIVGIVANPTAGTDLRRLVAGARTTTRAEKVSIARRVAVGAAEGGAERLCFLAGPHGIVEEACAGVDFALACEPLGVSARLDASDTIGAAAALRAAECGAAVVLGGDGTCRAFAAGWLDAPLVALSTGTNNVFPMLIEATVAGLAAGLVASGAVAMDDVALAQKVVHIEIEREAPDLALVDALLVADSFVGAGIVTDPRTWRIAVMARAEPAAVGVSAIGARLESIGAAADTALVAEFVEAAEASFVVRGPVAPGEFSAVGVRSHHLIGLDEPVEITGPGVLALDGERTRPLAPGQRATLRVIRNGPRLVDPARVVAGAVPGGFWRSRRAG